MDLLLTRVPRDDQPASCALGQLSVDRFSAFSLERPWVADPACIGGAPGRSCVPPGRYKLERHSSELHPRSFALVNPDLGVVHYDRPGFRSLVLIHVANQVEELRGCIALGRQRREVAPGKWRLLDSLLAIQSMNAVVPWVDGHTLTIAQA